MIYGEKTRLQCGFQVEGRLRDAIYRKGRYYDMLVMGILAHEFAAP
jgi:RimJ/RimL family protein N-acetyltransferase